MITLADHLARIIKETGHACRPDADAPGTFAAIARDAHDALALVTTADAEARRRRGSWPSRTR